jgi:hypothetical protein
MFGEDAGHAGERGFRDFFRLPPKKENRRQSVDPACRSFGKFVNARGPETHRDRNSARVSGFVAK